MKLRYLATAATLVLALATPAAADVILSTNLSGTGDNVVFQSLLGHVAVGAFNGQHTGIVDFTDLSNDALFIGAANGNDIKIANTSNLQVQVFNSAGTIIQNTLTDVFSLKGTGSVTAFVSAVDKNGVAEPIKTFSLGALDPNAQSGFTLSAINGEQITKFALVDTGGTIADFEHYRVDVAGVAAVPGPVAGAGLPGLIGACVALWGFRLRRRNRLAA